MKAVGERLEHRLVGRGAEQDLLGQMLAGGAEGRPAAAVVRGEAGVGKTRLLREVCANPDFLVLWGSCMHFGGASVPYAPVIGILQDWLATADPAEQTKVLAGAGDLGSLLPGMSGSHGVPAGRRGPWRGPSVARLAGGHAADAVFR